MSASTKKPIQQSLPTVMRGAINDGQQLQGQEWPCTVISVDGAIVTVAFEVSSEFTLPQVTCPIAESRYVRLPVQEGDQGMVMAASTRLGGVTGLGSGLAPLATPGNLGGLVFVPLGNKNWTTIDPDAVVIQAPNGAKILTDDGASEIVVDPGQVTVTQADVTVSITGGVVTITGDNVVVNAEDSTFNGNVIVAGNLAVTGADVTVSAATMTLTGNVFIVGSLTINGTQFAEHIHAPGSYHIGSNFVAGDSGIPI